jgi:hypothetical protein
MGQMVAALVPIVVAAIDVVVICCCRRFVEDRTDCGANAEGAPAWTRRIRYEFIPVWEGVASEICA